jgi:N-acyl-phosphatidylethanolamine-hydrolysing phospholipase D
MNPCPQRNSRFYNPHLEKDRRSLWHFLLWRAGFYKDKTPSISPPEGFSYPAAPKIFNSSLPSAVWIGHSTYLIDSKEWTVLTDPVFSTYCSPVPIRGLRRKSPPAIELLQVPKINAVFISHNHYDHLDAKAVQALHRLHPEVLWVLPPGLKGWFDKRGIERTVELHWGQSYVEGGQSITAVPAQHFSGRTLWDKGRSGWNGYVWETVGKKVYFAGDTGYNPFNFKEIGEQFAPIDLSLIPIGSYAPRRFMSPVHSSPADGVEIHLDVGSNLSLGMHWNTFRLSEEPFDRPPYDLYLAMKEKNLPFDTFLPQDMGVYVNW